MVRGASMGPEDPLKTFKSGPEEPLNSIRGKRACTKSGQPAASLTEDMGTLAQVFEDEAAEGGD